MSKIRATLIATLTLSLALPVASQAAGRLTASNGLAVAKSAQGIEVFSRGALPGRAYFCAAGDYARQAMRAGATDRLTIVGALAPSETRPGQTSVVFALSEPKPKSLLGNPFLWPRRTGDSLTVGHAQFLCNDNRRHRDD